MKRTVVISPKAPKQGLRTYTGLGIDFIAFASCHTTTLEGAAIDETEG